MLIFYSSFLSFVFLTFAIVYGNDFYLTYKILLI